VDSRVRRELRRLAGHLGVVRDADVILALLGTHVPQVAGVEATRLLALVGSLGRRRAKARRRLVGALDRPRYARLTRRLASYAQAPAVTGDPDVLAERVLAEAIERLAGEVEREPAMVDAKPSPESLHALRIAFKRLRYVLDFHAAIGGPAYDVEREMARTMQDVLGEVHDHDLLLSWMEAGTGTFAGPWPVLDARLASERTTLYRRFLRLRRRWRERTRAAPNVAPLEEPRFVHLEARPVALRLVSGGKQVASLMIS
jgi:CHAD domain-containing protein